MVRTRGSTITSFMQAQRSSATRPSIDKKRGRPSALPAAEGKAAAIATAAVAAKAAPTSSASSSSSSSSKRQTVQITLAEAYAAADEKAANSKFKPRPLGKNAQSATPQVDGHIPRGASILIIQRPWIDLILDGHKTLEIRGKHCTKRNERIYLALSGGGGVVIGSATFVTCHGPLSRAEWAARGEQHRVAGDDVLPYGGSTYAWELAKPQRFKQPVPYHHKPGVVVWAKME